MTSKIRLLAVVRLALLGSVVACGANLALAQGSAAGPAVAARPRLAQATFAGGCFWSMEKAFEGTKGVRAAVSGYSGGTERKPTYEQVSSGSTGHAEAVQVTYDPSVITYDRLLVVYWHNIDPLSSGGQFCDRGRQYRPAIFYRGEAERRAALASKQRLAPRFTRPVVTEIVAFRAFYPAEEYHQDYYRKNPAHYEAYRRGCGRDKRLRELWGAAAGHATVVH
jgi:peptide-methionine (S)-S-oxide reductase